jgi:hypothetical protein
METEMPALTAAPAMATAIIEPENLSRMMVSFALQCLTATGIPPMKPKLVWMVAFFGMRR